MSSGQMWLTDLSNIFSNPFSLFQLESKSYRSKHCWSYISYYIEFFFRNFLCIKTCILIIEPFCCVVLCYKKGPSLLPVLITELPTLVEQQIKTNAFYPNPCHYPLMTYLTLDCLLGNQYIPGDITFQIRNGTRAFS